MKLHVATCQFPIDRDIKSNLAHIKRQLRRARRRRAEVVHFPECALSGYPGVEFDGFDGFNWDMLHGAAQEICDLAKELKVWVILGSSHRLSGRHKPHNSLYLIDTCGKAVERYDKMFCTGSDLNHFSPGHHLPVFTINRIKCGMQICHDFRYQEVYRGYKTQNVQLVFHSYHNGHARVARQPKSRRAVSDAEAKINGADNIWGITVPATMRAYAANNHMWISANNTSARYSSWPSFMVRPDGVISERLRNNQAGVLLTTINTKQQYYDACAFRQRAMKGILHSGRLVNDPRSDDRRSL